MRPLKQVIHKALPSVLAPSQQIAHKLNLPFLAAPFAAKDVADSDTQPSIDSINSIDNVDNVFTKLLRGTRRLPARLQATLLTQIFSRIVPYVGTSGVFYDSITPNQVVVSLHNKRKVQNHIGTVHAVAVTLLAETATGFILALNLPSDRVLLVKSYAINFYRPLKKGQIAAVATLTDEQRQYILDTPKGELQVPCVIEDRNSDSDRDPISVEMTWAWLPKAELEGRRQGKKAAA